MADRTILITGITGQQGGAVAQELTGKGFKLRGLTRKPDSDKAKALAAKGVEIVKGDLDDAGSLKQALKGAWGVFAVQNTWEAGVEKEEEQGKRIAQMARESAVPHFVYTSVGSAQRNTGIPHFENKWRVENVVRQLDFPSHVILRPVFFMENLPSAWFLNGDNLGTAMQPGTKLQMIAVADIGRVGARAFTDAEKLNRREIDLAGDAATMPQAAEVLGKHLGRKINFVQYPIEAVRANSQDFALMLEWFDNVGYNADIAKLDSEFGKMTRLEDWAASNLKK
ncbi:MAG: NmrA/HSCARG family protein [Planctomycetes bacterium]|nr:NmrA/HSCARG family protein [Planctomycetota bacterium]MCW8134506.1 NmrA/HSCARG family protein [Planctomycetota bacterium]